MSALDILRKQIEERKQKAQGGTSPSIQSSTTDTPIRQQITDKKADDQPAIVNESVLQGRTL
jgi:hypothetical protein